MESELYNKTSFCSEYEKLLCVCVQSLNTWRSRREAVASSALRSKEMGDALMRLQADYAKAYLQLEEHKGDCELCHLVSKITVRDNASTAVMHKKHAA